MPVLQIVQELLAGGGASHHGSCIDRNLGESSRTKDTTHGGVIGVQMQGSWKGEEFEGKILLNLDRLTQRTRYKECGRVQQHGNAILSVNVGGSREALHWALEQEVAVLLIQEHRMLGNPMKGAMKKAKWMGWAGVWEEAHTTGKQSRSGGLATLVRAPTTLIG